MKETPGLIGATFIIASACGEAEADLTMQPTPPAGIREAYNGQSYYFAKCRDNHWNPIGLASEVPHGGCTAAGEQTCGGAWDHTGSCRD